MTSVTGSTTSVGTTGTGGSSGTGTHGQHVDEPPNVFRSDQTKEFMKDPYRVVWTR